jgi:hypothetical protein
MRADMPGVVGLEIPKAGRLKQNYDGHHFAHRQPAFALAMLSAIAQSGLLGVQLRQSSLAKFVAVNKELYNVNLGSPFCGWYFRREFIAFLTQKEEPRLYGRAYLLTLLQLLHRTHVNQCAQ